MPDSEFFLKDFLEVYLTDIIDFSSSTILETEQTFKRRLKVSERVCLLHDLEEHFFHVWIYLLSFIDLSFFWQPFSKHLDESSLLYPVRQEPVVTYLVPVDLLSRVIFELHPDVVQILFRQEWENFLQLPFFEDSAIKDIVLLHEFVKFDHARHLLFDVLCALDPHGAF